MWIGLSGSGQDQLAALGNSVMNPRVPYNFLTRWTTISVSRWIIFHGAVFTVRNTHSVLSASLPYLQFHLKWCFTNCINKNLRLLTYMFRCINILRFCVEYRSLHQFAFFRNYILSGWNIVPGFMRRGSEILWYANTLFFILFQILTSEIMSRRLCLVARLVAIHIDFQQQSDMNAFSESDLFKN
jgi:hypothetical protein